MCAKFPNRRKVLGKKKKAKRRKILGRKILLKSTRCTRKICVGNHCDNEPIFRGSTW